jgi:hypothetical protein
MRKIILAFFFLLTMVKTNAQNPYSNNPWVLGDSVMLDFSSTPPTITTNNTTCWGGSASVHDTVSGALLYSVINSGSSIFGNLTLYNQLNNRVNNSLFIKSSQNVTSSLILPSTNMNGVNYYLFSKVHIDPTNCGLYYSTISNSGGIDTGVVINKNNRLLSNTYLSNCITSVKHGNGKDWWILVHDYDQSSITGTNLFYTFLLDSNGVSNPLQQNIGSLSSTPICSVNFNSRGTNFIFINSYNLIEKFDFDRCTGIISNPQNITSQNLNANEAYYPASISPDDSKLYIGSGGINGVYTLYQFDLTASNVSASKCQIYQVINTDFNVGSMKLATDGKIYWVLGDDASGQYNISNTNLSVINSPNNSCANVNFQPFSFYLGGHKTGTILPNNPDFQLGPLAGSACAPFVGIEEIKKDKNCMQSETIGNTLYFNSNCDEKIRSILVYDEIGKLVFETDNSYLELSKLKQGFNILHINTNRNSYAIKKIVR